MLGTLLTGVAAFLVLTAGVALPHELPPGGTFTDDNGNVHEGSIEAIAVEGITRGCNPLTGTRYCPNESLTRGQMAAFIRRALNLSPSPADYFTDDEASVFESDINAIAAAGITRGCNPPANDRYCPDRNVTREQMAALLRRAFDYPASSIDYFTDDAVSIFEADINAIADVGVTLGCDPPANDRYCPSGLVRRDQMASFLSRALGFAPIVPPPPIRQRLVISGVGDVNLDPTFVRSFPSHGYEYAWSGLDDIFNQDDLTVINLECSASTLGSPWPKPATFRCDPDALPSMAAAGVDVANLANNHAIDYGFTAMLDARRNLAAVGIAPVGAGANSAEAYAPVLVEKNGWTIAILGGGGVRPEGGSWFATGDRPGMTDGDSAAAMTRAIRAADEIADLVLVTIHWGMQDTTQPRPFEIGLARAFIDAGADGIFGHHQHVLQPLGWYRGKPIAWGLGNFVWQAGSELARATAVGQFVFEPDGRIGACLVPVYIESTGHPVLQPGYEGPCAPGGS
ncbi:MAG: CapA family protein [Actinomycetota bacterium]|nr:CapA family protein [Actinomycetota bacterium]